MPIAHHDLDRPNSRSVDSEPNHTFARTPPPTLRRLSEESLPTELCEGPIPDSPQQAQAPSKDDDVEDMTSSREELIERLKKGGSPIWIPNRHFESGFRTGSPDSQRPRPSRTPSNSSNLLPAAQITPEKTKTPDGSNRQLQDGLGIERPRSALQWGDFTRHEEEQQAKREEQHVRERSPEQVERRQTDEIWISTSPPRNYTPFQFDERRSDWRSNRHEARSYGTSPLSMSPALSSSFAYRPPTSPLVTSQTNEDLEISEALDGMQIPASRANQRRHTLYSAQSSPFISPSTRPSYMSSLPKHRRQGSFQAHQPRRSLTSSVSFSHAASSPPTPNTMRPLRRISFGSESSPLSGHAAMVGSYEESILRGRMSTNPSKPIEFLAQIAVLGKGDCRPSLRCPAHVTLPFPAVYFQYSSTPHSRSLEDDSPSPYVGNIDLENGLTTPVDSSRSKKKAHNRMAERLSADANGDTTMTGQDEEREAKRASRTKRRSEAPRAPPGGSYRIPEKGQLQIVIKNGNKTAVKLFLIPYDLTGMEAGTKTFIRQRCSSFGPIIEGAATPVPASPASDKSTLRYLIHVHICCPSKGRFYLYKNIRVVFANRVPDGKEKLKSETTFPTPRFTPYKPIRVMNPPPSSYSGAGATLVADKASRRRSAGCFGTSAFDAADGIFSTPQPSGIASSFGAGGSGGGNTRNIEPIPFHFPSMKRPTTGLSDATNTTTADLRSPESQLSRPSTKGSGGSMDYNEYVKLNKGDQGYGGRLYNLAGTGSPDVEGLLSQRLRTLGQHLKDEDVVDDPYVD